MATIPACVVPGLQTVSVLHLLTADTGRVETMVAVTVSAAIAQTEQSRPTQLPYCHNCADSHQGESHLRNNFIGQHIAVQVDASTIFVG
ncbi:MAG: hypothetical protein IPN96_19585 [Anaerolineales bacterium]|nr:hypothetical protein [Anaerolineales bacterium]